MPIRRLPWKNGWKGKVYHLKSICQSFFRYTQGTFVTKFAYFTSEGMFVTKTVLLHPGRCNEAFYFTSKGTWYKIPHQASRYRYELHTKLKSDAALCHGAGSFTLTPPLVFPLTVDKLQRPSGSSTISGFDIPILFSPSVLYPYRYLHIPSES